MPELNLKESSKKQLQVFDAIVGLDLAISAGVAVLGKDGVCKVAAIKQRNPPKQLEKIVKFTEGHGRCLFVIEELSFFRNAKTVRSLSERAGFIYYTLAISKHSVSKANINRIRSSVECKSKKEVFVKMSKLITNRTKLKINTDHTDSIAIVLHVLDMAEQKFDGKFILKRM